MLLPANCPLRADALSLLRANSKAAGLFVQSVQQPHTLYAQLYGECSGQSGLAAVLVDGYAARFVDGDEVLMAEQNFQHIHICLAKIEGFNFRVDVRQGFFRTQLAARSGGSFPSSLPARPVL